MINAFIYDSENGKIIRSFFSTDIEAIALNLGDGEQAIDGDPAIKNPYVVDGALRERPENPATLNAAVIENVPVGAIVVFEDQYAIVDDGTAELEFPFSGTYFVLVSCFPYLPKMFEVEYAR